MGVGDAIAQTLVEKKSTKEYSIQRTAKFVCLGFGLVGPTLSTWYRTLSKFIQGGGRKSAVKKMLLDQGVFAPAFLAVFLTTVNVVDGNDFKKIQHEFQHKYVDILMTNYKIWPLVQVVNFTFVPLKHQVLLVQAVAIIWNAYLSHKTSSVSND